MNHFDPAARDRRTDDLSDRVAEHVSAERAASPASVLILMTALLMFTELIVLGGRVAAAHADVSGAAREAARQASVAQFNGSIEQIAADTASANLDKTAPHCTKPNVSVAGSSFRAGGQVTVTVSCTVDVSNFSILAIPWPTKAFSAQATEIIETYRAVE